MYEKRVIYVTLEIEFISRVLKVTMTPFRVIVMEDLKSAGFRTKKSRTGFKTVECEKVLEKLAKFHAASVQYFERVCLCKFVTLLSFKLYTFFRFRKAHFLINLNLEF